MSAPDSVFCFDKVSGTIFHGYLQICLLKVYPSSTNPMLGETTSVDSATVANMTQTAW